MAYVVISYDLHDLPKPYKKLDDLLAKKEFIKAPVDTVWTRDYESLKRPDASRVAREQFEKIAEEAGVVSYTLVVYSSEVSAIEIEQFKGPPPKPRK